MKNPEPGPDLAALANPSMEQYFLTNPAKIALLMEAAGILPGDDVVEVGAGAGTVARHIPRCRSLTLVELDSRMAPLLTTVVPRATVITDDALDVLPRIRFDVLLGNLPTGVTERLIPHLATRGFRVAVLAVGENTDLNTLAELDFLEITTIAGTDFTPPQPGLSRLVRVTQR